MKSEIKQSEDLTSVLCKGKLPDKWRICDIIHKDVSKNTSIKLFCTLSDMLGGTLKAREYQDDYLYLSIGNKDYIWDNKKRKWFREIEVKPQPPKFKTVLVYGNFSYGNNLNFFLIRIPGKGASWSKSIYPQLKKIVKKLSEKSNVSDKDFYFNYEIVDDKMWSNKKKRKRFEWRKDKFIEKRFVR